MGKKLDQRDFEQKDYEEFSHRVQQETYLLQDWCKGGLLSENVMESGFELELWLLNQDYQPATNNLHYLKDLNNRYVVSEVAKSSFEMNLPCDTLHDNVFERHFSRMKNLFKICQDQAGKTHQHIIAIGTLPQAHMSDFTACTLTDEARYIAMDNRFMKIQDHHFPRFSITGHEVMESSLQSFSMIGAMSSFQIHFRIGMLHSARLYNASIALSAAMVALSGNSPFVFGYDLWKESRIPLYEKLLSVQNLKEPFSRVSLGSGYIKHSLLELFFENMYHYTPFLPQVMDSPPEKMAHVQVHNGSIYRWNRPVIDFDRQGRPHFRVEHRAVAAGPSIVDMIANAAFYYGIAHFHTFSKHPLETEIPFATANRNFYQAARMGLESGITWRHGETIPMTRLILEELLPQAREGLHQLEMDSVTVDYYLSIIEERIRKNQAGSDWQRSFYRRNNQDFTALAKAYTELQKGGSPLHEWPIE